MRRRTLVALAVAAVAGVPLAWWLNQDDTASRTVVPIAEAPRGEWVPVGTEPVPGPLGRMQRLSFTDAEGACRVTFTGGQAVAGRLEPEADAPGRGVLRLGGGQTAFPAYHAAHDLLTLSDQRESRSFIPVP